MRPALITSKTEAQNNIFKEANMNGDAIIQRMAQRIAQLIAENEILKQELLEIKEANDGECKQDTES